MRIICLLVSFSILNRLVAKPTKIINYLLSVIANKRKYDVYSASEILYHVLCAISLRTYFGGGIK